MKTCLKCKNTCPFPDCVYKPEREERIEELIQSFSQKFVPSMLKIESLKATFREAQLIEFEVLPNGHNVASLAQSRHYDRYCHLLTIIVNSKPNQDLRQK